GGGAGAVDLAQEHAVPRVPRQEPVDQPSAVPDDLAGHRDQRRAERPEFHPQQAVLLGLMLPGSLGGFGHQQRGHVFRLQAKPARTMSAQLLNRLSTDAVGACTSGLSSKRTASIGLIARYNERKHP